MPLLKLQRKREFANWLRAYKILLDGEVVGRIRNGQAVTVGIAEGVHTVRLQIDWCRSNAVQFDVHGDEYLELACGSNYTGMGLLRGVGRMVTDGDNYLWLREPSGPSRSPPPSSQSGDFHG